MFRQVTIIIIFIFVLAENCRCQEPDPGPGYQMMMVSNPALAGSEGDGVLRLSYLNYYPGNNYDLHSVYFSYDSYFSQLHGGAGIFMSDNYLGGIINDFRGGFSYAYFLQAGKNLFVNGGLSASVYHRGFNFRDAVLPDQIDPLGGVSLPSSENLASNGKTVIDLGAGFVFISGKFSGGFSIDHLAQPDLSSTGSSNEKLNRKFLFHLSGDFNISETKNLKIRPHTYLVMQQGFYLGGAGASLEGKSLSFNTMFLANSGRGLNIQTGFSFSTGRMTVYYNYRFSAISGNKLIPLSLLHQTGLAFSLNNVEKRNTIKTINFPKL